MCTIIHMLHSCFSAPYTTLQLILSYLGEELSANIEGVERRFDRFVLHQIYQQRNSHNPFKLKQLQIVYIRSDIQTQFLNKVLSLWDKIIDKKIQQTKNKRDRALIPISREHLFWLNYSSLIGLAGSDVLSEYQKTVIINQYHRIEGVCYSKAHFSARYIRCMVTAPWNLIAKYKFVKGVGSAFIEHAALQSLKQQGINPDGQLPSYCLKQAIVQLNALETAETFYTNLFFVKQTNVETEMILTGENVVKFFERFGGRAVCKRDSIAV